MIGLVVVEWLFKANRPRNQRLIQAQNDQAVHTATATHWEAKRDAFEAQLLVEDAKPNDGGYDPAEIYWLLAQIRICDDAIAASNWRAMGAWADATMMR